MPEIKCTVTECIYNKDAKCYAPMIQVDRNGVSNAHQSDQTMCETFKSKE